MSDTERRDKALKMLQQQIAAQRARINPAVLARAAAAVEAKKPQPKKLEKTTAHEAIELFLASHPQKDALTRQLLNSLSKEKK